ncbi:nitrogen regulatory protein P-II [archaeon BMS3Abin16]|nr:nitrogen regulatory protein P-II [archaeon BMS3Abin16]GBE56953.1 nitrogen regulatory protein P-II [archaeon BMS3Bbin16]
MQEVIAIIRVNKMQSTKEALSEKGFYAMSAARALGRGKQRGLQYELKPEAPESLGYEGSGYMKYVPKRVLWITVRDDQLEAVVETIINANQTRKIGDGKIFVCPVENAIRVRTGEEGDAAII